MSRQELSLSVEKIQAFDLESLREKAADLNRRHLETYTTPFPKAPSRWISHYQFEPRPLEFTVDGEVEGRLSWLMGSLFDFSFTRAVFALHYRKEGGHCFDPASLFVLELAAKVDGYPDYASFCRDLNQQELGRRYRELAGLQGSIPGEDDLSNFRDQVGSEAINSLMAVFVSFFKNFGLIKGELLVTDGQPEFSNSRYKGCAHACKACKQFPLHEAHRQELCQQLQAGAKRLQILCPFPEVVSKVLAATTKKGEPHEPKVALLGVEYEPADCSNSPGRRLLAELLSVPEEQLPPLRIKWSHLEKGPQGELLVGCSKVPSDLEAKVTYHIDNKDPQKKERVFGYEQVRTTAVMDDLELELPVANSTYPANADEGHCFPEHRSKVALPPQPGQVHVLDGRYDQISVYQGVRQTQGIPIISYNPRNEKLSPEVLLERGYDENGTPYAPCGRLCHSNGYNYQANSRQYVCGLQCSADEQQQCPYGQKVRGYSQRMSFNEYPRLIGPIQRGTEDWKILYAARTASERTNSYDQEVILKGRPPRLRGLKAFSFSGAIRALAQLLRRALNFVLDVTYTLGKLLPGET